MYYGDIKPANFLVYRNQKVKYGDFGISFRLDLDDTDGTEEMYTLIGLTPGYCTPVVEKAYNN